MTREPWEEMVDAERDYLEIRTAMYSAGIMEQQLALALAAPNGQGLALQELLGAPIEMVKNFLDPTFDIAVTNYALLWLAREVLARLDPEWLAPRLQQLVTDRLDDPDPIDPYDTYRRVAELLEHVGQHSILAEVVRRAELSNDPDVLEVAEDYHVWGRGRFE